MKWPPKFRVVYSTGGALLGLGAPLGALALRTLFMSQGSLDSRLGLELSNSSFFYIYMAIGTVTAFATFGFMMGWQTDLLQSEKEAVAVLAITDGLTRVFNHRYLQERLTIAIEEAKRYKVPLSCMMLDIDDFKRINDLHGHPYGDLVLRRIAKLIRENTRHLDIVGRYGGEEFMVIMPHATGQEALPIAERVRRTIAQHPFSYRNEEIKITISIGIADYTAKGLSHRENGALVQASDEALYRAKAAGKNRAVIWVDDNPASTVS